MAVPQRQYRASGLQERVAQSGIHIEVDEIPGGRLAFQARSLGYLWRKVRQFDVILAQEVLRGALNANLVGRLRGVPVINYMGISPVEYFRCRRVRGQIGWAKALLGETVIQTLMRINGRLAARWLAMGPYLRDVGLRYCPRTEVGLYYGVDTDYFCPVSDAERLALRRKLGLPADRLLILNSSRISHEKDPETVLRAAALARQRGLDLAVLNLGGGYADFLQLAEKLGLPEVPHWVLGRPAAHPMTEVAEYFQTADVVVQASLAEGFGLVPLEAMACGTPVVATAVGGMARTLPGLARLAPAQDHEAMADACLWVAAHPQEAREQALQGRAAVCRQWDRTRAFAELAGIIEEVGKQRKVPAGPTLGNS